MKRSGAILIFLLKLVQIFGHCSDLPKHCQYIKDGEFLNKINTWIGQFNFVLCENKFDKSMIEGLVKVISNCSLYSSIRIKASPQRQIVDQSLGIFELEAKLEEPIRITFLGVKGFDIDSYIELQNTFALYFYTDFNLYKNKQIVKNNTNQ